MRKTFDPFKTILSGCALALAMHSAAQAGGFKVIHYFAGGTGDGALPNEVLPRKNGSKTEFFLTTFSGGEKNEGTISLIGQNGNVTILHSFGHVDPYDGTYPAGSLALDRNPDGTQSVVGTTSEGGLPGYGTIFEIGLDGSLYARDYDFQGNQSGDGRGPMSGLAFDPKDHYFYGTTLAGGDSNDDGTVYKFGGFVHGYSYGVLGAYSWNSKNPYATPLVSADTGDVYVTGAEGGGYGLGGADAVDTSGNWRAVADFSGNGDGANPEGTMVEYNGYYYGTTAYGGSDGLGTIFIVSWNGAYRQTLYSFKGVCCGRSDGSFPIGGLVLKNGKFYGTTINGGSSSDLGTVFQFDPATGAETVLHAFTGTDGAHPYARVAFLGAKALYGTTNGGGHDDNGVLFKMTLK